MAPRARLSQERSRQRRDALLAAAVDLFVEGGSRAVTHRAVAAAAGLPPATTTYYFESIDDLLREALQQHLEDWSAAMRELADADPATMPIVAKESAVQFAADVFAARPPETATRELVVILGAARDPELRDAAVATLATAAEVLCRVLSGVGIEEPAELADDLVVVVAGIALRRAAGVNTEAQEAANLVRALRHVIVGHLVGDEKAHEVFAGLRDGTLSGRSAASP